MIYLASCVRKLDGLLDFCGRKLDGLLGFMWQEARWFIWLHVAGS